ncbi:SAM-dependent methyltransferase [Marmoricola sp. OAE513]|uniref:class I SAM-dependent methyltransferase n=1 Tax=Marmoricola sp. OAE513 TaxID=2817894 RepID=UPI001AE1C2CA
MERRHVPDPGGPPNARTVASYELIAEDYARETAGVGLSEVLTRLVRAVPTGEVLEIGSGPGWDADALEEAGLRVRRTDITQAFLDLQAARGKRVERLDVVTDDLGGPYDGVVALHVLQHVEPQHLPGVLARISTSLRPHGRFAVAVRLGEGTGWEVGESGNPYFRALWSEAQFVAEIERAGMSVEWSVQSSDEEQSSWLTLLAATPARQDDLDAPTGRISPE